jgi:hypothetical protein
MLTWLRALTLTTVAFATCDSCQFASSGSPSLTAVRTAAVQDGVRTFMRSVAHDISQEGPSAWRRHFADSPSFFMASEGHLVFPNSASATAGIQDVARSIKQIELRWGDDLRIDPLTPDLAVVAASYHEVQVMADGVRVNETGFFTGIAERQGGRWQFRNAHWSVAGPASPAH